MSQPGLPVQSRQTAGPQLPPPLAQVPVQLAPGHTQRLPALPHHLPDPETVQLCGAGAGRGVPDRGHAHTQQVCGASYGRCADLPGGLCCRNQYMFDLYCSGQCSSKTRGQ